jgi:hypothetical protein
MSKENIKQLQSERDRWKNLANGYRDLLKESIELLEQWKKMYKKYEKE